MSGIFGKWVKEMISRKTTLYVANVIIDNFTYEKFNSSYNGGYYSHEISKEKLRDFLYEVGVDGWSIDKIYRIYSDVDKLKGYILNMETGRFYNTEEYNKFKKYGQSDLKAIIIGIFQQKKELNIDIEELENLLRIDGYIYNNGNLYELNTDIEEKVELVKVKYEYFDFDQVIEFDTFYNNMNEHFTNSKWEDSIHNGRKLYEMVLSKVAKKYSNIMGDKKISGNEKQVQIREYLEEKEFFSEDEINIVRYYYKYISNIGSHPKLALQEQADFCRVLTINICLYALKRLEQFYENETQ